MLLLSIGTPERGLEFCKQTGFDPARFLADPESNSYAPLGMKKGVKETFFSKETPNAIWADMKSGRIETLKEVMKKWTKNEFWIPPQQDQAFQQGGIVIFDGEKAVWVWRDPATGSHADLQEVVRVAKALKKSG
jgi:hypothetical protein